MLLHLYGNKPGTTPQNLPQAHTILRLLKLCAEVATPGMALLGEAIVSPKGNYELFWKWPLILPKNVISLLQCYPDGFAMDALSLRETKLCFLLRKIYYYKNLVGTSWTIIPVVMMISGWAMMIIRIEQAGFNPYEHRKFLKRLLFRKVRIIFYRCFVSFSTIPNRRCTHYWNTCLQVWKNQSMKSNEEAITALSEKFYFRCNRLAL